MNWTTEPPTKPGLYAWCDGRGGAVKQVALYKSFDLLGSFEPFTKETNFGLAANERGGFWQPLHVELPEPCVPPKPPKVEVYSAYYQAGDRCPVEQRWLYKLGDTVVAIGHDGKEKGRVFWGSVNDTYTNIERVPDETSP